MNLSYYAAFKIINVQQKVGHYGITHTSKWLELTVCRWQQVGVSQKQQDWLM